MKKTISAFLAFIFILTLSGCRSSDKKYPNLDYEDAVIIENTPNTGTWKKMMLEIPGLDNRSADKIMNIASNLGIAVEKKDLQLILYENNGPDGSDRAPLTEEAEAILAKYLDYKLNNFEDFPYVGLYYFSDDVYVEVQAPTGGMIEFDNRKNVNSVLELDYDFPGSWRPSFFKKSRVEVDINDENATCILDGKTVKVADAIKNAENYILENNVLFPESFGARVREADIYSYENTDNQSLSLRFEHTIDGVVLEGSPLYAIEDEDGNRYKVRETPVLCAMLTENTVDWAWINTDGVTPMTSEECTIEIDRDKACAIVSQKLSQEYTFKVEEIQLMYAAGIVGDGKNSYIEPMWRFYITGIEAQEYSRLYVYVSALDGEVNMAQVMG